MLILREILGRSQKRRHMIITYNSICARETRNRRAKFNPPGYVGLRRALEPSCPGDPSTARRPRGCPPCVSFTPASRSRGCKESEKPRIAELKKPLRDRKAARWRTVAPRRVVRGKSAHTGCPGQERQRGRDIGQVEKKTASQKARRLCSSPAYSSRRKGAGTKRPHAAGPARHVPPSLYSGRSG